jgi:hypothetical protein
MPRAQISGFTVISGSRILVPTEIATIDSAVVLPVTGTVEWVGTIGTIQTVVEVGTIDLIIDIATVQTVVGTIKTQEIGGTITATVLGTVLTDVKQGVGTIGTIISGKVAIATLGVEIDPRNIRRLTQADDQIGTIGVVGTIVGTVKTDTLGTISATIFGTVLTSVKETVGLQPGGTITASVLGTIKTQEIGGTITASILGTTLVSVKETVGLMQGGTITATILGSISTSLDIKGYKYDILISTILTGTNPATIISNISDIRGYTSKLISAYFTGTTMATILIEASRYSDSAFNINYPIGTINVVGTVADGKAYEILTDNWGYLRTIIVVSTIDTGSLSIEVDKQT